MFNSTRAAAQAKLAELGVTGPAAEALLRETARLRHRARVQAAKQAAVAEARTYWPEMVEADPEMVWVAEILAAALCLLDRAGIGGRDGVEGHGTTRVPAFRNLGSGRKHASDGDAWSAAIACAERELGGGRLAFVSPGKDGELMVKWQVGGVDSCQTILPLVTELLPWFKTLAREGLRRSLDLEPWLFLGNSPVVFTSSDDPQKWAELVNFYENVGQLEKPLALETAVEQ